MNFALVKDVDWVLVPHKPAVENQEGLLRERDWLLLAVVKKRDDVL